MTLVPNGIARMQPHVHCLIQGELLPHGIGITKFHLMFVSFLCYIYL
jgi:hypothetical protein